MVKEDLSEKSTAIEEQISFAQKSNFKGLKKKLMIRRTRQTFLKPRCGQGEANQVNKKHHEQSYERTSNHANHLDKESL